MAKRESPPNNWQRLLGLLWQIEFPHRYHALCLKHADVNQAWKFYPKPELRKILKAMLAESGLKFRYYRGEDFHRYHRQDDPRCEILFHVSTLGAGTLELSFYVQFRGEHILGDKFPALTKWATEHCAPTHRWDPVPGYLQFNGSKDQLRAAVQDGVELFLSVEEAILAETAWQVAKE